MKRVKAACICQTLHFMLKDDLGHDYAVQLVNAELTKYYSEVTARCAQYEMWKEGHTYRRYL